MAQRKLEQHQQAIPYFDKAIELNPELQDAYLYRAISNRELGNTAAYAQDLERAGQGQSGEILAGLALADAHRALQSGRASAALEALSRASALGANSCAVSYYRGDAFYRMGRGLEGEDSTVAQNERAKEMFQTAINHLQGACGEYQGYAQGLINNANQYIVRVDAIIRKQRLERRLTLEPGRARRIVGEAVRRAGTGRVASHGDPSAFRGRNFVDSGRGSPYFLGPCIPIGCFHLPWRGAVVQLV